MYSHSNTLAHAYAAVLAQTEQPVPGTVIRGLRGLPIRVHCQLKKTLDGREPAPSATPEIFAYATVVPLRDGLSAANARHYAQDFASLDFHGTKAVLLSNSRTKLLRSVAEEPILRTCDVLPVRSLRVVAQSTSGRALKVEVQEYCTEEELDICAGVVEAYRRMEAAKGTAAEKEAATFYQETLDLFYAYFESAKQEAAPVTPAAPVAPAAPAIPVNPVVPIAPIAPEASLQPEVTCEAQLPATAEVVVDEGEALAAVPAGEAAPPA